VADDQHNLPSDVRSAIATASRRLIGADVEDSGRELRVLLAHALQCSALDLIVDPARTIGVEASAAFMGMVTRRAAGEPLARILGFRDFYGRPFRLSSATLEPRPDSECLIDTTLKLVRTGPLHGRPVRILDIGTGSGCLLLTLLAELPLATGVGTDLSADALATASQNAEILALADRAAFQHGSCAAGLGGPFDVVISNPPYIRSDDLSGLDAEVRTWDPALALDGGVDGLDVYRAILRDVFKVFSDGYIVFEVGYDQALDVENLIQAVVPSAGQQCITITRDMAGRPRCVALSTHMTTSDEIHLGI
jgi:release factor glutamine methyltransferase